jgi:UDP-N-acetylglucosamine 2-epimerase (non-hydrolysing)
LAPAIILTGQHPGLNLREHGLSGYPALRLGCPGREDPNLHVADVADALTPHLIERPPALLLVQGDTSSALGGALAGFARGVAVAHVEAGLRSGDPRMPWPEEDYRVAIDARAELLFAPTHLAARNLSRERVPGTIHVTGNSGIDALLRLKPAPAAPRAGGLPQVLVSCHRRENWGEGTRSVASAVEQLAREGAAGFDVLLHPNAHVSAALATLLDGCPGVRLVRACSHGELIRRVRAADLVLSDSGGIQEEAPALGIPLFVLHDKTERPEGIATGNTRLVGTNTVTIVESIRRFLGDPGVRAAMSAPAFPFGDGTASARIAGIVAQWMAARNAGPMQAPSRQVRGRR